MNYELICTFALQMKRLFQFLIVLLAVFVNASATIGNHIIKSSTVNKVDSTIYITAVDTDSVDIDTISSDSLVDSIQLVRSTRSWKKDIRNGLDEIMESPLLNTSVVGLEVWDLDDDVCLYSHGERQRLRPASTLKVITAITALKELGTGYNFATRIYYSGNEPDSTRTWRGDVYVVGGMDPRLSSSDIASLAGGIRKQGVDSILGTVYADQSFKDSKKYGSGWCWDDNNNPLLLPLKYRNKDQVVEQLIACLRRQGVYVSGAMGAKSLADSARLIAEHHRPLRNVMRPMLKNSNNACAESVFYAMINHAYGRGACALQGQALVKRLMRDAGSDDTGSYDIVDGSGLSLYDYVDAHVEVLMLRYAWQHKDMYDFIYPLLPVAGRDGTLRKRMLGTVAAGNVHAKTGTVTGIRSLCGYLTASNGHHIAFSIINQGVSGSYGSAKQARDMQDRICELLCE